MDYYGMYRDIWTFHKRYVEQIRTADDRTWDEIVTESSSLSEKYNNCDFIRALVLNEVNEFERIAKSGRR